MPKSTATSRPVVVDEQIARVHVGMEEAVAQRVAQERLHHGAGEMLQVEALGLQRGAIVERRALDPFERQHVFRGAVPIDRRHAEIRIGFRVLGKFRQRRGFEPQIHFDGDRTRERVDHLDEAQPLRFRRIALGAAGSEVERIEVVAKAPLDAGPQHLHGDGAANAADENLGAMHLRDRRRRDRRTERGEHRRQRLAERLRHGCLRLRLAETAPSCPAGFRDRARAQARRRRAASPGTGRASRRSARAWSARPRAAPRSRRRPAAPSGGRARRRRAQAAAAAPDRAGRARLRARTRSRRGRDG